MSIKHEHAHDNNNENLIISELACHFPYGVFSVAFSLVVASILGYFSFGAKPDVVRHGAHVLFHSCHFLHVVFATTGAALTFFRYSKNLVKGFFVCATTAILFCVLSDIVIPYGAGRLLGVAMTWHICFISEMQNVIPFLVIGLVNGWVLSVQHRGSEDFYSVWSHFMHIFVSSLASTLYLVSHGFDNWYAHMGVVFCMLLVAVVIPCTMSDVVVPIFFAKHGKKI